MRFRNKKTPFMTFNIFWICSAERGCGSREIITTSFIFRKKIRRRPKFCWISTNWNLSALKFRMLEKDAAGAKDVEFAKDADWLVSNLLDPQWVVSIRIQ